jgi:hypothetical protein
MLLSTYSAVEHVQRSCLALLLLLLLGRSMLLQAAGITQLYISAPLQEGASNHAWQKQNGITLI